MSISRVTLKTKTARVLQTPLTPTTALLDTAALELNPTALLDRTTLEVELEPTAHLKSRSFKVLQVQVLQSSVLLISILLSFQDPLQPLQSNIQLLHSLDSPTRVIYQYSISLEHRDGPIAAYSSFRVLYSRQLPLEPFTACLGSSSKLVEY